MCDEMTYIYDGAERTECYSVQTLEFLFWKKLRKEMSVCERSDDSLVFWLIRGHSGVLEI